MSEPTPDSQEAQLQNREYGDHAPADAIEDFGDLHPRQVDGHEWRVLSLASDTVTAYEVDVAQLTCSCPDEKFREETDDQLNPVCKHLAVALFESERRLSMAEYAPIHLSAMIDRFQTAVQEAETALNVERSVSEANVAAATESDETDSDAPEDPVETVRSKAEAAGVPVGDGVKIYGHPEYDSVQVEKTGYIEDFQALKEFTSRDVFSYDSDTDVNYVRHADIENL